MKAPLRWVSVVTLFALSAAQAEGQSLREVVERVETRYNRIETLRADFVQRYTLGSNTIIESGRVFFLKPGRMRWEYESPEEKLFLTDGTYAYTYLPEEGQVQRAPLKEAPQWQAAFALMVGKVDLDRLFDRIQLVTIGRPDSPVRWQLRGTAKSDKQGFREMWLDFNERYQLLRLEIRQIDGALMEFHFRRWRENRPLLSDLFELHVPPGTVWIDTGS